MSPESISVQEQLRCFSTSNQHRREITNEITASQRLLSNSQSHRSRRAEVGLRGRRQPDAPPSEERFAIGSGDSKKNRKQVTFPVSAALKILFACLLSGLKELHKYKALLFFSISPHFVFFYTNPPLQVPQPIVLHHPSYSARQSLGSRCCSLQGGRWGGGGEK